MRIVPPSQPLVFISFHLKHKQKRVRAEEDSHISDENSSLSINSVETSSMKPFRGRVARCWAEKASGWCHKGHILLYQVNGLSDHPVKMSLGSEQSFSFSRRIQPGSFVKSSECSLHWLLHSTNTSTNVFCCKIYLQHMYIRQDLSSVIGITIYYYKSTLKKLIWGSAAFFLI